MASKENGNGYGKGSAPDSGTGKGNVKSVNWDDSVQGNVRDASPAGSGTSKVEGPNPGR